MDVEFPGPDVGSVARIEVDGHEVSLFRGELRDVVLKVAGKEMVVAGKNAVVPDDPEAIVAAVRRLAGKPAA